MMWALQSFFGTLIDATVGQMVHAFSGPRPSPPPWDQGRPWEPAPAPPEPPARDDRDLQDGDLKLVRYTLVSLRRCEERILPGGTGEVMVQGGTTADSFAARIIAEYLQPDEGTGRGIPPGEERYLRVYWQVLARWPLKCKSKKTDALKGIRDALREASREPVEPVMPVEPPPQRTSVIAWDGTGTPSQVDARGSVTLTKEWNGRNYDVTLEGTLTVESPSYGHVRHGLPPGFLPSASCDCAVQESATRGDLSGVDNYGGRGVHVRRDGFPGYEGRATLWFPERYDGEVALRCTWQTDEATDPGAWAGFPGIRILRRDET